MIACHRAVLLVWALFVCVVYSDAFNGFIGSKGIGKFSRGLQKHAHFPLQGKMPIHLNSVVGQIDELSTLNADSPPYALSVPQQIYVILTSIFVTCLIVADVIGVKIFEIKLPFKILGHSVVEHTCGMLTFPITFLLGDIINEYYGPKATKKTVYIGLAMSILVFFMMNIAQALPYLNKPFNGKNNFTFVHIKCIMFEYR